MKCHCSLLADLKNEDKIGRTFLKGEHILLLLTKLYKKIRRKLIISYSNKMQPQLMLQKCNRIFLLVPRKSESHLKSTQKQAKSITEADEPKTSSLVKPRSWNNFVVRFQNLKQIVIIRANQKKFTVKNNLKQIKSNFFSIKNLNKSHQNFSTMLLGSWKIKLITWMLATLYTSYIYPKC